MKVSKAMLCSHRESRPPAERRDETKAYVIFAPEQLFAVPRVKRIMRARFTGTWVVTRYFLSVPWQGRLFYFKGDISDERKA